MNEKKLTKQSIVCSFKSKLIWARPEVTELLSIDTQGGSNKLPETGIDGTMS